MSEVTKRRKRSVSDPQMRRKRRLSRSWSVTVRINNVFQRIEIKTTKRS